MVYNCSTPLLLKYTEEWHKRYPVSKDLYPQPINPEIFLPQFQARIYTVFSGYDKAAALPLLQYTKEWHEKNPVGANAKQPCTTHKTRDSVDVLIKAIADLAFANLLFDLFNYTSRQ